MSIRPFAGRRVMVNLIDALSDKDRAFALEIVERLAVHLKGH